MHKMCCLCSDGVTYEVHTTTRIDVSAETVGLFATQYFAENGRKIPIIIQISVNGNVKRLGIPADASGYGWPFNDNFLASTVSHSWGRK